MAGVELGLKVSWLICSAPCVRSSPKTATCGRCATGWSGIPRGATYEARLELGDRAAQALAAKRDQEADELVAALEHQAVGVRRNDPISELMVLNAAFLVERRGPRRSRPWCEDLDHAMQGAAEFHARRAPAAYNFVGLDSREQAQAREGEG